MMKISRQWLNDFIDISHYSDAEIANLVTFLGAEVESIDYFADFSRVVAGKVRECRKLTDSKNYLCSVDIGSGSIQIVCGAPNVKPEMLVPVILLGGTLPNGETVVETKISSFISQGMICSQFELRLGGEADIIWDIGQEAELKGKIAPGDDLRGFFPRDTIFTLEITHNRPDLLSHYGVARDIAGKLGLDLKYPQCEVEGSAERADRLLQVDIYSPDRCPRYCGRIIEGIEIKSAPRWMQRRLLAVGLRPINNIVDVTNYVLMELGHPLHAFDLQFIHDKHIIVKTAFEGEKFCTLDGKEHILTREDLLICDAEKGVALAGVMGGLNSEITANTKEVLLECAYFAPVGIRNTSKQHNITSDSSYRFERGVDPNAIPQVIDRTARLILETAGGRILQGRVDNYAKRIFPVEIELQPSRVNFLLGSRLRKSRMAECLKNIGCIVTNNKDKLMVQVPTYRPDITQEIDLVEEIVRIDGYEKVKSAPRSLVSLEVAPLAEEELDNFIRRRLIAEGMQEVISHSMRPSAKCGISDFRPVAIRNPLSADFAVLRTDLYAPLLEIAGHNLNNESKMVKIFEIGHIFRKLEDDSILERKLVAGLMTGIEENVFWNSVEKDVDFYYFKGAVENFITSLALNDVALISHPVDNQSAFEYGQIVCVEEESIGEFGKLRSEVAERFDIKTPVFLFAFDYPLLLQKYRPVTKYQLFSRFPTVNRDLSIIVEEAVSAIDIETVLRAHGGDFLLKLEFFDLYRGKQLPEGKKSLSVSLRFGSTERTLTDTEVDVNVNNIISAIIAKGWKLRE